MPDETKHPRCETCRWRAEAAEAENARLRADRDRLHQTVLACVRDYNATRKPSESQLGEGGLILAMAELLKARADRDALLALLESGQALNTHDLDVLECHKKWVIDDVAEVRATVRRIQKETK